MGVQKIQFLFHLSALSWVHVSFKDGHGPQQSVGLIGVNDRRGVIWNITSSIALQCDFTYMNYFIGLFIGPSPPGTKMLNFYPSISLFYFILSLLCFIYSISFSTFLVTGKQHHKAYIDRERERGKEILLLYFRRSNSVVVWNQLIFQHRT